MQQKTRYPTPKTKWLASAIDHTVKKACHDLTKQAVNRNLRNLRNERIRIALSDDEQARLIRLQLHQDRRKRIEAGIRALGICGRLRGDCRSVWTRRTITALNKARRVA